MPYKSKSDLPDSVQHVLPAHAQDIYKEAFNSAWEQYKDKSDAVTMPPEKRRHIRWRGPRLKMITKKVMMVNGIKRRNSINYNAFINSRASGVSESCYAARLLACKRAVNCLLSSYWFQNEQ